jgi:hypothetical protein
VDVSKSAPDPKISVQFQRMVAFGEALDGALAQYFDKPQEQSPGA